MYTYLALFRGINVSGHNMIKMEPLKKLLEANGFNNVQTYIQSGNVVFNTTESNKPKLARDLENLMYKEYGYNVVIFVLDIEALNTIITGNPYTSAVAEGQGAKKYHVVFLSDNPHPDGVARLKKYYNGNDEYTFAYKVMYLKLDGSAADSKLTSTFIESKINVKATTRNWNTTLKMMEMMSNNKLTD